MGRDRVTSEMRAAVLVRDALAMSKAHLSPSPICIAPVVDPDERGRCWGRSTLDHVKSELRMGVRAKSDMEHLVAVCQGHMEDGRKAGYQWNTAHRAEQREYLAR